MMDLIECWCGVNIWHSRQSGQFFIPGHPEKSYVLSDVRQWARMIAMRSKIEQLSS